MLQVNIILKGFFFNHSFNFVSEKYTFFLFCCFLSKLSNFVDLLCFLKTLKRLTLFILYEQVESFSNFDIVHVLIHFFVDLLRPYLNALKFTLTKSLTAKNIPRDMQKTSPKQVQ